MGEEKNTGVALGLYSSELCSSTENKNLYIELIIAYVSVETNIVQFKD